MCDSNCCTDPLPFKSKASISLKILDFLLVESIETKSKLIISRFKYQFCDHEIEAFNVVTESFVANGKSILHVVNMFDVQFDENYLLRRRHVVIPIKCKYLLVNHT